MGTVGLMYQACCQCGVLTLSRTGGPSPHEAHGLSRESISSVISEAHKTQRKVRSEGGCKGEVYLGVVLRSMTEVALRRARQEQVPSRAGGVGQTEVATPLGIL